MQNVQHLTATTRAYWRVVLALAAKDIVDALKNKTTLTMIVGLALTMLTVEALPLLLKLDDRPYVAIYDAARTGLADELRREGALHIREMRNAAAAQNTAREASTPLVALILPAGWESGSDPLIIDGYIAHWIRPGTATRLVTAAEQSLMATSGRPLTIRTEVVYPTLDNGGHTIMVAMGLVLGVTLITTILVPYLILEEKSSHTLDLLRVSPVSSNQLLLGKGIAGLVYGILAACVLLAFNLSLVHLWSLMLSALLALVLFGVALGLLVGTLVHNEGSVQMCIALLSILLMFPLVLGFFGSNRLPEWVQPVIAWLPTTAAFDLVRLSFGHTWLAAEVAPRLIAMLLAVVLVFAVAGWRLRRWEA